MRFIGSKKNIVDRIDAILSEKIDWEEKNFVFADLFAGTGAVANHFKDRCSIVANDLLYSSYVFLRGQVAMNEHPSFGKLREMSITDPVEYLNSMTPTVSGFVTNNYSPDANGHGRKFFSQKNAMRIDTIRTKLDEWKASELIDSEEFFYLLNILLQAVPFVSNITGTYGAYLKHWDKRSQNTLKLSAPILKNNNRKNVVYNQNANQLAKTLNCDIVYIDTPYNGRQYTSNYHILDTIALYDNPEIKGVSGIRLYSPEEKSLYCSKRAVREQFVDLFKNVNAQHIVLSYSSDGLITKNEMLQLLKQHFTPSSVECVEFDYRRYKSKIVKHSGVVEYLFYARSKQGEYKKLSRVKSAPSDRRAEILTNSSERFVSSPLNYIGGKFKLLPQISQLFPDKINTFVDLFCGGLSVGCNINANKVVANDYNYRVIEVLQMIRDLKIEELLHDIYSVIQKYSLSSTNKAGFLELRKDYNRTSNPLMLYVLVCYSFNYQFRFNNSGMFNNPFGKERSQFSERLRDKLILFNERIRKIDIDFFSLSFDQMLSNIQLEAFDFVYCDPPYLITTGSYNDGNRGFKDWKVDDELLLYSELEKLNERGIRFALSNVIEHKGLINEHLAEWSKRFNINELAHSYTNSSYNTRRELSREVLITNY